MNKPPPVIESQLDLFGPPAQSYPVLKNGKPGKPKTNPMIESYGTGPTGAKCVSCVHQYFRRFAKSYSKCELRGATSSPKTDHNSRYHACGLFNPKTDTEP